MPKIHTYDELEQLRLTLEEEEKRLEGLRAFYLQAKLDRFGNMLTENGWSHDGEGLYRKRGFEVQLDPDEDFQVWVDVSYEGEGLGVWDYPLQDTYENFTSNFYEYLNSSRVEADLYLAQHLEFMNTLTRVETNLHTKGPL